MNGLNDSFGFLFAKANQRIEKLIYPALNQIGITPKQMGLILIVQEYPGITQIGASELQQIDRTTMTQLVDSLEDLLFIKRIRLKDDRRAYGLYLTEQGERVFVRLQEAIHEVNQEYFKNFSDTEVKQLREMLLLLIKEEEVT